MKITRTKVTASNHFEVPDEAGFEAWIYEKFGMKKSEVSSAKWEELRTKYFNKYRSETVKKNATYKDDKRLSPTSLRYKGYLIHLDRGGDGYNVYDKYRELEDAGFASLDAAKKFVDEIAVESSICASGSTKPGTIIVVKKDYPIGWIDGEDLYLPAGTRLEYYGEDSDSGLISLQDIDSEEPQLVNLTEEQYYKAFRQGYFKKAKANVSSAEEVDDDDENDLDQVDQEFTSKETSINSGKLPAIYKLVNFPKGSLVIDYGGGKFDNATEYLDTLGVTGLVYDPYNRTTEHNRSVIKQIRENGGADIALCSNVLNVIKEEEARLNVLKNIRKLLKSSGTAYITVYEGKGTGEAKQSQDDAYQLHRKTADYLDEIHKVFPDATRKGKLIIATPTGEVTASCNFNIRSSSNFDWDYKTKKVDYCPHCTNRTLVETEDSYFVCDECGSEYEGYPTYEGGLYLKDLHKDVESGCDINAGYDPYDLGDEDLGLPFVKEELIEFGDSIAEKFSNDILGGEYGYQLSDIYVDTDPSGKKILLHIELDNGDITTNATVAIDKRRIKRWTDLFKYEDDILNQMKGAHDEWYHEMVEVESSADIEYDEYGKEIGSPEPEEYEFVENYKGVDIKKWVSGGDPEPSEYSKTYVTAYPDGTIFGLPFKTLDEAKSAVDDYQKSDRYYFKTPSVSAYVSSDEVESSTIPYKNEEFKKELQDKLYNKASKVLQTPEFGFPLNEIAEVLFVEIHEDDYNIIAEVRGELSYEGMYTLARVLNPIVEKYSKDAYFDMVEPGIMEAYLPKDDIKSIQATEVISSSYVNYVDEYPESFEDVYEVVFDFKVNVEDSGVYTTPEEESAGEIYDDTLELTIADKDDTITDILDLISVNIPDDIGTYRVSGIAKMKYTIDNVYMHHEGFDGSDSEYLSDISSEYDTSNADVRFDLNGSWVENLQIDPA